VEENIVKMKGRNRGNGVGDEWEDGCATPPPELQEELLHRRWEEGEQNLVKVEGWGRRGKTTA
jgi:hypothetical protein